MALEELGALPFLCTADPLDDSATAMRGVEKVHKKLKMAQNKYVSTLSLYFLCLFCLFFFFFIRFADLPKADGSKVGCYQGKLTFYRFFPSDRTSSSHSQRKDFTSVQFTAPLVSENDFF